MKDAMRSGNLGQIRTELESRGVASIFRLIVAPLEETPTFDSQSYAASPFDACEGEVQRVSMNPR